MITYVIRRESGEELERRAHRRTRIIHFQSNRPPVELYAECRIPYLAAEQADLGCFAGLKEGY